MQHNARHALLKYLEKPMQNEWLSCHFEKNATLWRIPWIFGALACFSYFAVKVFVTSEGPQ